MISVIIKEKIEQKFNSPVRYSKDCENLANAISNETRSKISGSTIKRIFGIIPTNHTPSLYTLDVISKYLGYPNFDELINEFRAPIKSNNLLLKELIVSDVNFEERLEVHYDKNHFIAFKRKDTCNFETLESNDKRLAVGDTFTFKQINLNYPLFIENLIRGEQAKGDAILGKIYGVRTIEKILP
jgi:hypothetical protein